MLYLHINNNYLSLYIFNNILKDLKLQYIKFNLQIIYIQYCIHNISSMLKVSHNFKQKFEFIYIKFNHLTNNIHLDNFNNYLIIKCIHYKNLFDNSISRYKLNYHQINRNHFHIQNNIFQNYYIINNYLFKSDTIHKFINH